MKAGETVEVTERGRLVALLVPPGPSATARDRLVAEGRLVPGSGHLRPPRRTVPGVETAAVLDQLRDEG